VSRAPGRSVVRAGDQSRRWFTGQFVVTTVTHGGHWKVTTSDRSHDRERIAATHAARGAQRKIRKLVRYSVSGTVTWAASRSHVPAQDTRPNTSISFHSNSNCPHSALTLLPPLSSTARPSARPSRRSGPRCCYGLVITPRRQLPATLRPLLTVHGKRLG